MFTIQKPTISSPAFRGIRVAPIIKVVLYRLLFIVLSFYHLFIMIKSEDGIKRRGDFFWTVGDFSFEKDTIGHIFTGQYYGLHLPL